MNVKQTRREGGVPFWCWLFGGGDEAFLCCDKGWNFILEKGEEKMSSIWGGQFLKKYQLE